MLAYMQFLFKIITYIQADTEKGPFRSNCRFSVSAYMYVMILNGKLHTSKLQKLVSNRIFHKEEKEKKVLLIYLFLLLLPPTKGYGKVKFSVCLSVHTGYH